MTGQCYYCAKGEHHECYSETCTCCGERNIRMQKEVDAMVEAIRRSMKSKPTASEMDRFLGPIGAPDEFDHDREEE